MVRRYLCKLQFWNFLQGGVITERCYGCGRCFPVCPYDKISQFKAFSHTFEQIWSQMNITVIDVLLVNYLVIYPGLDDTHHENLKQHFVFPCYRSHDIYQRCGSHLRTPEERWCWCGGDTHKWKVLKDFMRKDSWSSAIAVLLLAC